MMKLICFDLDGVYFTEAGKKGFVRELEQRIDSSKKHILHEFLTRSGSGAMYELCLGILSKQGFVDALNQQLDSKFSLDEVAEMWTKYYEINKEIQFCIENLRNLGYIIGAVTNNNAIRIDALQEKLDFMKDFDVFVSSHLCGYLKPCSQIFERLIDQSNCKAEEIIYADDREDRLNGARNLGIHCYMYDSLEGYKELMREKGIEI